MIKINDRIIMTDVPEGDHTLAIGDYGRVIDIGDLNNVMVKFKRALDPSGHENNDDGVWGVEPHEYMICHPRITWKQIEMLADIIRESV